MSSYVTQEYDFHEAIIKSLNVGMLEHKAFAIDKVIPVLGTASIVETTHGKFYCESFESEDHKTIIYMKVTRYL